VSDSQVEKNFLSQCRKEYIKMACELDHDGLDLQAIEKTRSCFIDKNLNRIFLREEAYKPTGLVLGSPLPKSSQVELFASLASMAEAQLNQCFGSEQQNFALVPKDWYHITIANRTHYELSTISCLDEDEKHKVEDLISKLDLQEIRVIASGLILTASGRLSIKCLPIDDRILQLRSALEHALPWLQAKMPGIVHIKLGHLMKPMSTPQLQSFMAWLAIAEQHAICDLVFSDLYTPKGRISL
jgi:hypothetical protein